MRVTVDESKLNWMNLETDEELEAARKSLAGHQLIAVKLLREPSNAAAGKTVRQHFAKDCLDPRPQEPKPVRGHRRGGRIWEHRPAGSSLRTLRVGATCVVPRDSNLLKSLRSIRRFIAVAGVPS